jgi:hypothetical protein
MTIKITQTCNKCKKDRELTARSAQGGTFTFSPQDGGWRPFGDKHVCPDCVNQFIAEMG